MPDRILQACGLRRARPDLRNRRRGLHHPEAIAQLWDWFALGTRTRFPPAYDDRNPLSLRIVADCLRANLGVLHNF
jgi:hypothetical protein